jgi:hypothetical protein
MMKNFAGIIFLEKEVFVAIIHSCATIGPRSKNLKFKIKKVKSVEGF